MKSIKNIRNAFRHPYYRNNFVNVNYFDRKGLTLLHMAAYNRDAYNVQKLLDLGAFPNMSDIYSTIPLQIAVIRDSLECVKMLTEYPNKYGHISMKNWTNYVDGTSLAIARKYNYESIIHYLSDH